MSIEQGSRWRLAGSDLFRRASLAVAIVGLCCLPRFAAAVTVTWRGTTDNAWNTTTANWAGGSTTFTNGDTVTFDDTATGTTGITIGTAVSPGGTVTISNTTKNYSFSGASGISGTSNLTKTGAGALTFSNSNSYVGTTTLRGGTTTLLGNAVVTMSNTTGESFLMSTTAGDNATLVIQDNATFNSTGSLRLATTANSTVTVLMSGGTASSTRSAGTNGAYARIGDTGTATWNQTGGLFVVSGQQLTLGRLGGLGQVSVSSGTFRVQSSGANGGLISVGSVGNGILTISGNGVVDSGPTSGLTLVNSSGTTTASGVVNLDGGTLQTRGVSLGLAGATATFNFNGGTLVALVSSTTYLQGLTTANVKSGGAIIDTNGYGITIAQSLLDGTGGGGLTKLGSGTLTLSGSNTYTGVTTISAGALQVGNAGTTGSLGAGNVTNNAALLFNRSDAIAVGNAIAGSGSLTNLGSGTLALSGSNTYTGGTFIKNGSVAVAGGNNRLLTSSTVTLGDTSTAGTLVLGDGTARNQTLAGLTTTGSGGSVVGGAGSNSTLTLAIGSGTSTYAGILGGAGTNQNNLALTKAGAGTLILNGSSGYRGGTVVDSGVLVMGNAYAMGSSSGGLTVNSGAKLDLSGQNLTANALSLNNSFLLGFNLGSSPNRLAVSSASVSGTNYLAVSATATGTYELISSAGGGLGGTFMFRGAQNLTVPATRMIARSGSSFLRLQLNNTGTAEQLFVTNAGTANLISIMPLGASISGGVTATGTAQNGQIITSYDGGGYHTQLYQNLVNDGRFVPNFVGNSTDSYSSSASGPNLLQDAGQTRHEGHSGYTTSQILWNLNHDDGNASNYGGFWLSPTNANTSGIDTPDYIPLYVGGNDFGQSQFRNTSPIDRYNAILTEIHTLRPDTASIAATLMYRNDVGSYQNTYFNPYVEGVVYDRVLAGEDVRFLDLYTLLTPANAITNVLSRDGVHPSQAGYNMMADAINRSITLGAAYWTGSQDGNWSTVSGGTSTNWAMDRSRLHDRQASLNAAAATDFTDPYGMVNKIYPDVFFNTSGTVSTTVDTNVTIRGLNFTGDASGMVSIGGTSTLTIGSGGITVQPGTGRHTLAANVALADDQSWGNVSGNDFTVSGVVTGTAGLTIVGAYTTLTLTDLTAGSSYGSEVANTQSATTVGAGGAMVLSGNNQGYSGTITVRQNGTLKVGHRNALGTGTGGIVLDGGRLDLNGVSAVVGLFTGTGGTVSTGGTAAVVLTASSALSGTFSGVIANGSGKVGLTKSGAGTLTLAGTAANTSTGITTITAGSLWLGKTSGVNAIAGDIQLGDGSGSDVLRLNADNQIADTSVITLTGSTASQRGWFQLQGHNETVGGIASSAPGHGLVANEAATGSNSALTLNVVGSYEFSGLIRDGSVAGGSLAIVKTGVGRQILSGSSTYSGSTVVNAGVLQVASTGRLAATSSVTVSAGAELQVFGSINAAAPVSVAGLLSGTGSIGAVTLSGTLAPGASIGEITTRGLTWNGGAIAAFELGGSNNASDRISILGDFLKGTGGAFRFDFQNGGYWDGVHATVYTLATWTGSTNFAAEDFSLTGLGSGLTGSFEIAANSLNVVVVPEPSSAALLLGALGALAAWWRRAGRSARAHDPRVCG